MNKENKVQFGLEQVHIAPMVNGEYIAPIPVPGAVNLKLDPVGEINKFYADNCVYYASSSNDGYEGDLEVARFPMEILQKVWGYALSTTDKVLTEVADAPSVTFALLFKIQGDIKGSLYVIYACTGTRPGIEGKTSEEGKKEPITQSSSITSVPLADGKVVARTTEDTPQEVLDSWFTKVYLGEAEAAS